MELRRLRLGIVSTFTFAGLLILALGAIHGIAGAAVGAFATVLCWSAGAMVRRQLR